MDAVLGDGGADNGGGDFFSKFGECTENELFFRKRSVLADRVANGARISGSGFIFKFESRRFVIFESQHVLDATCCGGFFGFYKN